MKKIGRIRVLIVLTVLICLVALSFVTVYADESKVYNVKTPDDFLSAVDAINNAEDGSYEIVLLEDIDFTGWAGIDFLTIEKNTVTIKGSGHGIILYNTSLSVTNNAVLNLGTAEYSNSLSIRSADNTRAIIALSGSAVLNMYKGVSVGGNSLSGGQAGGVQMDGSSIFNMYGGVIHDCINWASVSGGVLVGGNGVFTMHDGEIRDCSGYQGGGVGVIDSGLFVMNGGKIINCTDNWYGGGGVNVFGNKAGLTMNGGKITGCRAENTVYGLGGGIFAYTGEGSISLNGGEIANNHAAGAGDDVFYYGDGGKLNIGNVPDGLVLDDCRHNIDGWYVDGVAGGVDMSRWNENETDSSPIFVKPYKPDGSDVTEQLALKAAHAVYNYKIEYYIEGVYDSSLTEYGTAVSGTLTDEEIPDKCPNGYNLNKRENGEITEPDMDGAGGPGSFTVKIYYTEVPKTEDNITVSLLTNLFVLTLSALAAILLRDRKAAKK